VLTCFGHTLTIFRAHILVSKVHLKTCSSPYNCVLKHLKFVHLSFQSLPDRPTECSIPSDNRLFKLLFNLPWTERCTKNYYVLTQNYVDHYTFYGVLLTTGCKPRRWSIYNRNMQAQINNKGYIYFYKCICWYYIHKLNYKYTSTDFFVLDELIHELFLEKNTISTKNSIVHILYRTTWVSTFVETQNDFDWNSYSIQIFVSPLFMR
jgi:hypothetical protein